MDSRTLAPSDREALELGSGIPPQMIAERGYWTATSKAELRQLGFGESQLLTPALVIPMWTVDGNIGSYQIRPHQPRMKAPKPGKAPKPVKYESPAGSTNMIDVPPCVLPLLEKIDVPLWLTEGVKKADCSAAHGLACIALAGVWSWLGKVDGGASVELSDWNRIALKGRRVYLAFDSDLMENPQVLAALRKLGEMLTRRGAIVRYVYIPTGDGRKVGLDDYLVAGGDPEELVRNSTATPPFATIRLPGLATTSDEEGEKEYKCTDLGNAQRLIDQFGDDIRYSPQWATWLVWQGNHWEADHSNSQVQRMAHAVVRGMWEELAQLDRDDPRRKQLLQWAQRSESNRGIRDMLEVARTLAGISVTAEQFDVHPHLINVRNGTIDLRSMTMREHRREDLLTKHIDIPYNPEASIERWSAFLHRILPDPSLVDLVGRMAGYALSGENNSKAFFFLYGSQGNNGKSVFVRVLQHIFGSMAVSTPTETFIKNPLTAGKIPADIARLRGTRLCIASEIGENQKLNEELIRKITGGDEMTARFMHKDYFDFKPRSVILMTGNYRPVITGADDAIWKRMRIIPFEVSIPDSERILDLDEQIINHESEGVLAWLVYYCRLWRKSGLGASVVVEEAVKQYREESDLLGHFIEECIRHTPMYSTRASLVYERYVRWCKSQSMNPMSNAAFGRRMSDRIWADTTDQKISKFKDRTGWHYKELTIEE